jgi:flagella basal body P-ring formation protein FlgA
MRRLAAAFVVIPLLAASTAAGAVPVLRDSVIVDEDLIRLGDLFDGIGEKADVAVAPAPRLGRRGIYDAAWLLSVARTHDLSWKPQSRFDRIIVERASLTIGAREIETALKAALAGAFAKQGPAKKIQVELDNRNLELHVAPGPRPEIRATDLRIDDATDRFTASVAIRSGGRAPLAAKVSGRIFKVVEAPVLQRSVAPGEIIAKDDIEWVELRSDLVNRNVIMEPEHILGLTPRRRIMPGVPLRSGDVRLPVVVKKGGIVTMVLETRAMQLTAQGRAVENGTQGEVIKVMNTQSRTVVDAVVEGPSRVTVAAPPVPR